MNERSAPEVLLKVPEWVYHTAPQGFYHGEKERMALAVALARQNVERKNGGPFGAAIFERESGKLVAPGVNLVLPMKNSVLHAEVVAIMLAELAIGCHSLGKESGAAHELVTSCEPCAMCLGAAHWSGVSRLVTGATREDVQSISFDEGPVFPESYRYLAERGVEVVKEVLRSEARAVLQLYEAASGRIY